MRTSIIEKILKQLTPERIKKEVEEIQKLELSPELRKWVREYEKVGERTEFIWKWTYNVVPLITFSIVDNKYKKSLFNIKLCILSILTFIINDVADKLKNERLLNELLKTPFLKDIKTTFLNEKEKTYLFFTSRFWKYILNEIKHYPRYNELKDIFEYDITQVLCANKYDYLITTQPYFINKSENYLHAPYTMGAMVGITLDIMCSSKFDIRELGMIRKIGVEAQKMVRIGNWLSTWEREIYENDFTSAVVIYALEDNIMGYEDLKKKEKKEIIRKIKNSEIGNNLLKEWEESYKIINGFDKKIKSFNLKRFLSGLEKLLILELCSKAYK